MGISRTYAAAQGSSSSGIVRSTQQITGQITGATTTADVVITSVNTSYTIIEGTRTGIGGNQDSKNAATYYFTSPTNVRLIRGEASGTGAIYKLFVTEFFPTAVKSLQSAEIAVSATSVNATITSVNATRAMIIGAGFKEVGGVSTADNFDVGWAFNSGVQVVATINTAADHKARYQVLELN